MTLGIDFLDRPKPFTGVAELDLVTLWIVQVLSLPELSKTAPQPAEQ